MMLVLRLTPLAPDIVEILYWRRGPEVALARLMEPFPLGSVEIQYFHIAAVLIQASKREQ